jgi:hypothetical protein
MAAQSASSLSSSVEGSTPLYRVSSCLQCWAVPAVTAPLKVGYGGSENRSRLRETRDIDEISETKRLGFHLHHVRVELAVAAGGRKR